MKVKSVRFARPRSSPIFFPGHAVSLAKFHTYRYAFQLAPQADPEGLLARKLHRQDPGVRGLFKSGCGRLPARVS
jgi:hypothetical protein